MDFLINSWQRNGYNGHEAAKYALTYGLSPNPSYKYLLSHGEGGGDCTNFISQCLKAGGAQMDYVSIRPWWYNNKGTLNTNDDSWSMSWAVAHSLYWCLKTKGEKNIRGLKGIEVPDISMFDIGDLLQYEDFRGLIYHSTIITSFTYAGGMKVPLVTQHSYDAINTSHIKPKAKKIHLLKIQI